MAIVARALLTNSAVRTTVGAVAGIAAGTGLATTTGVTTAVAGLAFLATEGAFMLRYMGLAEMSDLEWSDVFCDIEHCAERTVAVEAMTSELKGQTS